MSEALTYDVVIVGGGPAGLSAAIKLKQLALQAQRNLSVCILEKGSEIGAHILSGAVLEPRALEELFPDWRERHAPLTVPVTDERFLFLTQNRGIRLPTPPQMHNKGNYIVSLGNVCRWLAKQAEEMGVEVYSGFAVARCLFEQERVIGVETTPMGVDKQGNPTERFEPGVSIFARHVLFAEGCRGSLTQQLIEKYKLSSGKQPQTYGMGLKELWEVKPENHRPGTVIHTIGWPLDTKTYGGSFIYHLDNLQVVVGFVIGLDYENPYLSPFEEFQRFKTHPKIRPLFEGGKRLSYGARALNEGGYQSIPHLSFPGGSLIGCAAGFMNVPKIKGTHTAMKSAMIAAETIFEALEKNQDPPRDLLNQKIEESWIGEELKKVRNIRPGFRWGLFPGLVNAALETYVFRGRAPWTLSHHKDHESLKKASECQKIDYPKPDGHVTFDRLSSVYLSNTSHEENQPSHLHLKDTSIPIHYNLKWYDAPEQRYCPANVYEIVQETSGPRLQINAANCVHCKTCDIKDPLQNIQWVPPEGGGGPRYPNM